MCAPIVSYNNKFRWTFESISTLEKDSVRYSDDLEFDGVKWRLGIKKDGENYVDFYLCCVIDENEKSWICYSCGDRTVFRQAGTNDHQCLHYSCYLNNLKSEDFLSSISTRFNDRYSPGDSIIIEFNFDFILLNMSKKIPNYTDFILKVGDVELNTNKGFLCSISTFFMDLFIKNNFKDDSYIIENVELDVFLKFLLSTFPNNFDVPVNICWDEKILPLAKKYGVRAILVKDEENKIAFYERHKNYSVSSCDILDAEKNEYSKLLKYLFCKLDNLAKLKNVVKTVEFEQLSKETRKKLLTKLLNYV